MGDHWGFHSFAFLFNDRVFNVRLLAMMTLRSESTSVAAPEECPVCSQLAWNKHFGVVSCNACGAFFRRTVALRKAYSCFRRRDCGYFPNGKMRCKFCRFQASIIAGFNISSVIVRPIPNEISCFEPTTVFERLNICNRAKFVNRFFYLVQVHDGRFENVRIGIPNPSAVEIFRLLEAEFLCDLSAEMIRQLAHVVFQEWIVFQCVVATANNNGKMTQEFYLPDESHLNVTVEHLTNCVRMLNGQIDKDVLARAGVSYLTEVLETAAIYQQARLDNREFAAMVQLLLLREASKLFPENAATRRFTHTIFQALQQHYELNFEETPIRIGQIVSLIDQIGSLSFSLNELVIMWKLNGIDSIFRLPAQISPQFTLASGPVSSLYTPPSSCTSLSDDLCSV